MMMERTGTYAAASLEIPAAAVVPTLGVSFETVYDAHFHDVERWLRALGVPASEREDMAQEVFIVVERKLGAFDGRHLKAWLYRIAANTASDFRRRSWFRNFFSRRETPLFDDAAIDGAATPVEHVLQRERVAQVSRVLSAMSEKRRVAFVLFEIEGQSCDEIAEALGIPVATVWTRLHHARREFRERVAALDPAEGE
jgi:RNA polymerase sigma-70 factor (ECF subfamily)